MQKLMVFFVAGKMQIKSTIAKNNLLYLDTVTDGKNVRKNGLESENIEF